MLRRLLKEQIDAVHRGDDPIGIIRDPARDLITTTAGNALVTSEATL